MAVSQIEEKILGRLAKQTAPSNPLLSASLYQVLGLSILLTRKLYRARRLRKLDITRDTKSLQLYHHIIWLAREGLSITEVCILPYCQDGEQGPECRVMAAKLRASWYHVFCLFHNHPPVTALTGRSNVDLGTPSSPNTPRQVGNGGAKSSPKKSPQEGRGTGDARRRPGQPALRDPIPSMTSVASYVTNPYASIPTGTTPPPGLTGVGGPHEARRTPSRPPGLAPINVPATQAAASFLLPPLNFVPMAREHFETTQHLANSLLPSTHALRLSVALEHAAFLWDCAKEHERARRLARRTIKEVYRSSDGLDDEEFADASILVQSLGGMVRRGSNESTPVRPTSNSGPPSQPPTTTTTTTTASATATTSPPNQRLPRAQPPPHQQQQPQRPQHHKIDRTIAISPAENRRRPSSSHLPQPTRSIIPDRLSTVPEDSFDEEQRTATPATSLSLSRLSSTRTNKQRPGGASSSSFTSIQGGGGGGGGTGGGSGGSGGGGGGGNRPSPSASEKDSKRKLLEQAEERAAASSRASASAASRVPSAASSSNSNSNHRPRQNSAASPRSQRSTSAASRHSQRSAGSSSQQQHSRQATPTEGYVRRSNPPPQSQSQSRERKRSGGSRNGGNG